jgi:hypothetical protein
MKTVLVILIGLTSLLTTACKDVCSCKKVACPEFNDPLFDKWFPYNANQQIIFKTTTGKTDTITIDYFSKSPSYEAKQGCTGAANGCSEQANIYSYAIDGDKVAKFNVFYTISTPFTSSLTTKSLQFHFHQFTISATDITTQGLVLDPSQSVQTQNAGTVNLNGSIFSAVQILQRDTVNTRTNGPYKLYLSQNTGIAGYETLPGGELWVRQ